MKYEKKAFFSTKNPDMKNIEMEYSVAVLCEEMMINDDDDVVTHGQKTLKNINWMENVSKLYFRPQNTNEKGEKAHVEFYVKCWVI